MQGAYLDPHLFTLVTMAKRVHRPLTVVTFDTGLVVRLRGVAQGTDWIQILDRDDVVKLLL